MSPRLRCNIYSHPTQIGSGVSRDQRVPNSSAEGREPHQGLGVLTVCEEAIALDQGSLHIAFFQLKSRVKERGGVRCVRGRGVCLAACNDCGMCMCTG